MKVHRNISMERWNISQEDREMEYITGVRSDGIYHRKAERWNISLEGGVIEYITRG